MSLGFDFFTMFWVGFDFFTMFWANKKPYNWPESTMISIVK